MEWRGNTINGGYSFEDPNFTIAKRNENNEIIVTSYNLGVDLGNMNEGSAFRLYSSRRSGENPPLNSKELAARGLSKLYALVNKNRKDFVFARNDEAQFLLDTGDWLNASIGFVQEDFAEFIPFGEDPRGTHLYVLAESGSGTRELRRYRNECTGVHFHAIDRADDSNEGGVPYEFR